MTAMPSYRLAINGSVHDVDAPEDMPVLWVLRDLVGLTGTKFGCGVAQCRACTVLVDGVETASCQLAVKDVGNAKLMTIEGLSETRAPKQAKDAIAHTIQQVWIEEDVVQCGFCQPGQLLTTYALLTRNPKPTDADIDTAFSGNICRCGTYNRIRKAVHKAADVMAKGGAK